MSSTPNEPATKRQQTQYCKVAKIQISTVVKYKNYVLIFAKVALSSGTARRNIYKQVGSRKPISFSESFRFTHW